mgnify:FL=1
MSNLPWSEKYRPRTLADVKGNPHAVTQLRAWGSAWERGIPDQRGVILAGPAGCGKTSAALALAAEMGWEVVELNASDARSGPVIEGVALRAGLFAGFGTDGTAPRTKLILLDEADNLYERPEQSAGKTKDFSDRGGRKAVIRTLRETRQPVILTVNDLYALTKGSGGAFRRIAQTIKFQRLPTATIREVLTEIAAAENIEIEPAVVQRLAANASGDLRGALNDLQSLAEGGLTVDDEQVDTLGVRDRESEMFDTLRAIFEGDDYDGPRKAIFDLHEPPGEVATWVSDNLPRVYRQPNDLERAYRRVAYADLLLARTRRQQNYGLWGYASELLSSGVALSRRHPPSGVRLQFPSWIRKMGASRGTRAARDSLAAKIGAAAHMSKRQAKLEQLAVVATSCRGDADKAARIAGKLELTEGELAQLLGTTPKDRKLKAIMEASQPFRQEREVITLKTRPPAAKRAAAASDEAAEPAKPDVAADRKQKSLFDF